MDCYAALIRSTGTGNISHNTLVFLGGKQDGTEYGSRVASSEKTLQFFVCFISFLLFYVLDVVSITVYDRHAFKHWFVRRTTQTGL